MLRPQLLLFLFQLELKPFLPVQPLLKFPVLLLLLAKGVLPLRPQPFKLLLPHSGYPLGLLQRSGRIREKGLPGGREEIDRVEVDPLSSGIGIVFFPDLF